MKDIEPRQSKLWEHINQTQITKESIEDIENFKSNNVNFKISLWNPKTNGMRYLKTLMYNLASLITSNGWKKIAKIKNRNTGNPITIKYNNEEICMDYMQAVFEIEFIEKNINLGGINIFEIGSGYGRTCHSILSNYNVKSYTIVDLENCLELSRKYLEIVLNKKSFLKIKFIRVEDIKNLNSQSYDLCLNIDSFAEMEHRIVNYYLEFIAEHCKYFYTKNPIGKYLDKSLDNYPQGEEIVKLAMSTGIMKDVIDIHDNNAINAKVDKYIKNYCPGLGWVNILDSWAKPWSYYWQVFYKKEKIMDE